jgi:hypothetical protein
MKIVTVREVEHEPISLEEAKNYLRVETDVDDNLIRACIKAARIFVENYTGKSMLEKTISLELTGKELLNHTRHKGPFKGSYKGTMLRIILPRAPFVRLFENPTLTRNGEERLLNRFHTVNGMQQGMLCVNVSVQAEDVLRITYVIGYGRDVEDIPELVRHAILSLTARLYEERGQSPEPFVPNDIAGFLQPYCVRSLY